MIRWPDKICKKLVALLVVVTIAATSMPCWALAPGTRFNGSTELAINKSRLIALLIETGVPQANAGKITEDEARQVLKIISGKDSTSQKQKNILAILSKYSVGKGHALELVRLTRKAAPSPISSVKAPIIKDRGVRRTIPKAAEDIFNLWDQLSFPDEPLLERHLPLGAVGLEFQMEQLPQAEGRKNFEEMQRLNRSGELDKIKPKKTRERKKLSELAVEDAGEMEVKDGSVGIARAGGIIRYLDSGGIGPCIAVTLYDKKTRTGAMLHFLTQVFDAADNLNRTFAYLREWGVDTKNLEARIIGGDNQSDNSKYLFYKVHKFLCDTLGEEKIVEIDVFSERLEVAFLDLTDGELYDSDMPEALRQMDAIRALSGVAPQPLNPRYRMPDREEFFDMLPGTVLVTVKVEIYKEASRAGTFSSGAELEKFVRDAYNRRATASAMLAPGSRFGHWSSDSIISKEHELVRRFGYKGWNLILAQALSREMGTFKVPEFEIIEIGELWKPFYKANKEAIDKIIRINCLKKAFQEALIDVYRRCKTKEERRRELDKALANNGELIYLKELFGIRNLSELEQKLCEGDNRHREGLDFSDLGPYQDSSLQNDLNHIRKEIIWKLDFSCLEAAARQHQGSNFKAARIIYRTSATDEDTKDYAKAGRYASRSSLGKDLIAMTTNLKLAIEDDLRELMSSDIGLAFVLQNQLSEEGIEGGIVFSNLYGYSVVELGLGFSGPEKTFKISPLASATTGSKSIIIRVESGEITEVLYNDIKGDENKLNYTVTTKDGRKYKITMPIEKLKKVTTIAKDIERKLGHPVDIEFGVKDETIYIVQIRPVTADQSEGNQLPQFKDEDIIAEFPLAINQCSAKGVKVVFIGGHYFGPYLNEVQEKIGYAEMVVCRNSQIEMSYPFLYGERLFWAGKSICKIGHGAINIREEAGKRNVVMGYFKDMEELVMKCGKMQEVLWKIFVSEEYFDIYSNGDRAVLVKSGAKPIEPGTQFAEGAPFVIAHRGLHTDEPENTREAFKAAAKAGIPAIEMDVRLTKDGVPVMFHDDSLDGKTTGTGRVEDLTWDELKAFRYKNDNTRGIPRLEDVVGQIPGPTIFVIELKDTLPDPSKIIEVMERLGVMSRTVFISSELKLLKQVKAHNPDYRAGYILHDPAMQATTEAMGEFQRLADMLKAEKIDILSILVNVITPEHVRIIHSAGLHLNAAWDKLPDTEITRLKDLGVDSFALDEPVSAHRLLTDGRPAERTFKLDSIRLGSGESDEYLKRVAQLTQDGTLDDAAKRKTSVRRKLPISKIRESLFVRTGYAGVAKSTDKRYLLSMGAEVCILCSLYDPKNKIGAMIHIHPLNKVKPAFEEALKQLEQMGADVNNLEARMMGDPTFIMPLYDVPPSKMIIYLAKLELAARGIRLVEEDIGEGLRSIFLDLETGEAFDLNRDSFREMDMATMALVQSLIATETEAMVQGFAQEAAYDMLRLDRNRRAISSALLAPSSRIDKEKDSKWEKTLIAAVGIRVEKEILSVKKREVRSIVLLFLQNNRPFQMQPNEAYFSERRLNLLMLVLLPIYREWESSGDRISIGTYHKIGGILLADCLYKYLKIKGKLTNEAFFCLQILALQGVESFASSIEQHSDKSSLIKLFEDACASQGQLSVIDKIENKKIGQIGDMVPMAFATFKMHLDTLKNPPMPSEPPQRTRRHNEGGAMAYLAPASRFGKYDILLKLGKGGMGKVYLAEDTGSGKTVALKVISADLMGDAESVRKFKQEGEMQKKLKHPSIPEVYETGEINGTPFMAMQYIRERALNNIIAENRPDIRTALAITEKIARALDDLHKQGIIHLDIKPGNILLDDAGDIYILDFGLAMALPEKGGFVETGRIIGTPGYLSPQSIEGSIDRRTDIYSLGVVLYEMLAGRLPFVGGNNEDVLRQTYDDNPLPPRYFNPEIPEGVEAIVLKAISKSLTNRYQSAGEFADAIHSYLNGSRAALALNIEQIPEKMPAKELLRALELDKAEVIKTEPGPNGTTINTIRIPQRLYVDKPPQGLEILHNELAPMRDFELLINAKGYVIAVFPVITEKLRMELDRTGYFYFDLSSYYFEVPKIGDPDAKTKWQEFRKRREADKSEIADYKNARQVPDELEDISQTTHPYAYVELDKGTGLIKTIPFGSQGFDGNFIVKPDVHQAILPIFPTVYGASEHEYGTDKGFLSFVYRGRANGRGQLFGLEKGSSVLVMGPGSGIDTWVASLVTQAKVYAAGINPIEVANVRAFAKIAGFEVEAKIHDNIITDNGTPVFPQKFDRVIWNMPAYIDASWREARLSRHLSMYWDGDMYGMTLKRFALGLPAVLKSTGRGLVWNMPAHLFPKNRHTDIVEEIFRSAAKPLDVVRLSVDGAPVPFYLISLPGQAETEIEHCAELAHAA